MLDNLERAQLENGCVRGDGDGELYVECFERRDGSTFGVDLKLAIGFGRFSLPSVMRHMGLKRGWRNRLTR